jgi:hypothetical protein
VRRTGDLPSAVSVLTTLSALRRLFGDVHGGEERFDEALELARHSGDDGLLLEVIGNFGNLFSLLVEGEDSRAEALASEAVEMARRLGRPEVEVSVMRVPAVAAFRRGDLDRAQALSADGLRLARTWGLVSLQPGYVIAFAWAAAMTGQNERAARLTGAGIALNERLSSTPSPREREALLVPLQPVRAALGEERWAAAEAEGQALSLEEAVSEALGERE